MIYTPKNTSSAGKPMAIMLDGVAVEAVFYLDRRRRVIKQFVGDEAPPPSRPGVAAALKQDGSGHVLKRTFRYHHRQKLEVIPFPMSF